MAKTIGCPAGMSGLMVEPWSKGEVYAVAADWAQAGSPVLVYGEDGWGQDSHGRQVADFRHSARAALESQIIEALAMSEGIPSDEVDSDEVESILGDAVEVIEQDVADMIAMLERHGDRFTGNNAAEQAQAWIGNDFSANDADDWCEIGVWDADTAATLRGANLSPRQVETAAESLVSDLGDNDNPYTDGDPIYSVCNGDTNADELIDAANIEA